MKPDARSKWYLRRIGSDSSRSKARRAELKEVFSPSYAAMISADQGLSAGAWGSEGSLTGRGNGLGIGDAAPRVRVLEYVLRRTVRLHIG